MQHLNEIGIHLSRVLTFDANSEILKIYSELNMLCPRVGMDYNY